SRRTFSPRLTHHPEPVLSETEAAETTYTCDRCDTRYAEGDACPACGALREPVPCDDDPAREARFRCVICGRAVCGDDPEERKAALCDIHRTIPVIEGFAQVYSNSNELAARLVVDNLRAEGLEATLYSQADRSFPMEIGEMSIARVLVPTVEAEQALELIADY